jgi:hypothetical protein
MDWDRRIKTCVFKKAAIIAHQRVSRASRISECQKSLQARDTLSDALRWCDQKHSADFIPASSGLRENRITQQQTVRCSIAHRRG